MNSTYVRGTYSTDLRTLMYVCLCLFSLAAVLAFAVMRASLRFNYRGGHLRASSSRGAPVRPHRPQRLGSTENDGRRAAGDALGDRASGPGPEPAG